MAGLRSRYSLEWPREYEEYVRLFNERDFFEAHEVLEDLWVVEVEPLKNYYKGLIQIAVAFCHWERGNPSGARKLYLSGRAYLEPYPDFFEGMELEWLLTRVDAHFERLLNDPTAPAPDRSALPILELREGPPKEVIR